MKIVRGNRSTRWQHTTGHFIHDESHNIICLALLLIIQNTIKFNSSTYSDHFVVLWYHVLVGSKFCVSNPAFALRRDLMDPYFNGCCNANQTSLNSGWHFLSRIPAILNHISNFCSHSCLGARGTLTLLTPRSEVKCLQYTRHHSCTAHYELIDVVRLTAVVGCTAVSTWRRPAVEWCSTMLVTGEFLNFSQFPYGINLILMRWSTELEIQSYPHLVLLHTWIEWQKNSFKHTPYKIMVPYIW
jgi:hypothetical protein